MTKNQKILLAIGIGTVAAGLIIVPNMLKSQNGGIPPPPPGGGSDPNPGGGSDPNPGGGGNTPNPNPNPGGGVNPNVDPEYAQWVRDFINQSREAGYREDAAAILLQLVNTGFLTYSQQAGVKYHLVYKLLDPSTPYSAQMQEYKTIYDLADKYDGSIPRAIAAFSIQSYSNESPVILPAEKAEKAILAV